MYLVFFAHLWSNSWLICNVDGKLTVLNVAFDNAVCSFVCSFVFKWVFQPHLKIPDNYYSSRLGNVMIYVKTDTYFLLRNIKSLSALFVVCCMLRNVWRILIFFHKFLYSFDLLKYFYLQLMWHHLHNLIHIWYPCCQNCSREMVFAVCILLHAAYCKSWLNWETP